MSMRETEESAFVAWRRDPTPARLAALLTSVQDRVYTICLQILRRPEDAEDACQEILMEVAKGAGSIDEPRPFKVWLYRVAVHTALDRKEAIVRQARLARSAPAAEGPAMNETERTELMRALGKLDDRTRCMVIEHYFDKATLEEIAAREGVSAVAIWKRLERARESLRHALLGAGFAVGLPTIAEALEAVTPAAAPAGLIGKIALTGGIAMGTKAALTVGSAVAAVLLLGATAGGGYFVGTRLTPAEPAPPIVGTPLNVTTPVHGTSTPLPPARHEPEVDDRTDWDAVAQEAFDYEMNVALERIPFNRQQSLELNGRLNPRTGPWFAKRYRQALESMREAARRRVNSSVEFYEIRESIELGMRSGGPEFSEVLLERLNAPDRYGVEVAQVYLVCSDIFGTRTPDRLPFTPGYLDVAKKLIASGDFDDLRAGYAILGWVSSKESLETLKEGLRKVQPHVGIHLTIARSLGRLGDDAGLKFLKASGMDPGFIKHDLEWLEAKVGK